MSSKSSTSAIDLSRLRYLRPSDLTVIENEMTERSGKVRIADLIHAYLRSWTSPDAADLDEITTVAMSLSVVPFDREAMRLLASNLLRDPPADQVLVAFADGASRDFLRKIEAALDWARGDVVDDEPTALASPDFEEEPEIDEPGYPPRRR